MKLSGGPHNDEVLEIETHLAQFVHLEMKCCMAIYEGWGGMPLEYKGQKNPYPTGEEIAEHMPITIDEVLDAHEALARQEKWTFIG